jgi:hypothetical protein
MQDRCRPARPANAPRRDSPSGVLPDEAVAEICDVLDSIRYLCPDGACAFELLGSGLLAS